MILSNNENKIYIRWRENDTVKEKLVDYKPYFFVKDSYIEPKSYKIKTGGVNLVRNYTYEKGDFFNINNEKLKKVFYDKPSDLNIAKRAFQHERLGDMTYEADVSPTVRYAIDNLESMPEYRMRKWYWDMEWQQGGEYHDCITTIVAYDNYDKKYYQWVWLPIDEQLDTVFDTGVRYIFSNEKEMLENFIVTMADKDPDMLIAWFGLKFDLPKLLERCIALDIDATIISPMGKIEGFDFGSKKFTKSQGYSPISQAIKGRLTLNLDMAFERQWNDAQKGTLPSLALDYVSEMVLGEKKMVSQKFEDMNEFYRRAWLEETETYLEYAVKDVELIVRIDEENYCSESILALQRLLVAPFDSCFFASHMASIYFMRNAGWKAITSKNEDYKECSSCGFQNPNSKELKVCKKCGESLSYSGAMIYHPLDEKTNGLHFNVAAFDFAGLYPSMIIARNISFETKSETPTEFGADLNTPQNLKPLPNDYEKDMKYFKTDKLGLLPNALLELKSLRNEYKSNMKKAQSQEEYAKWYNNQMAVKRLSASFYGVLAKKGYGWGDVELASSITASAREAIRYAAFKVKEMEV